MQWLLAIVVALLLAAGLAWWMDGGADRHASSMHRPQHASSDRGPTLYRWTDAAGVVNITDTRPKSRPYTIVRINPDRNIVPMAEPKQADGKSSSAPRPR